jgi:hypothetical protein
MRTANLNPAGDLTIPASVKQRYGLKPNSEIRIVETSHGILLVPSSNEPPSEELKRELDEWQELGSRSWANFPYDESPEA